MRITSPIVLQCIIAIGGCIAYLYTVQNNYVLVSILICTFLLCLILYLFDHKGPQDRDEQGTPPTSIEGRLPATELVLFLGILAGLGACFDLIYNSSQAILDVARYYSRLRYTEGSPFPLTVRILNVILYPTAIVCNIVFFERLKMRCSRYAIYCIPSVLLAGEAFLLGTKSTIVLIAIYGILAWRFVSLVHGFRKHRLKTYLWLGLASILAVSTALSVHYVRSAGRADPTELLDKIFTSYLFVPFFALISMVSAGFNYLSLGYSSFMGIATYFDDTLITRQDALHFSIGSGVVTNVYTAYFYLINDFGLIGFFLIVIGLGMAIRSLEQSIMSSKIELFPLYLCLSTYVLFAFAGPIFKFLTNILVFLLIFIYFRLIKADGTSGSQPRHGSREKPPDLHRF